MGIGVTDPALCGGLGKGQPEFGMPRGNVGGLFPPTDRDVDIERVQLDYPSDTASALGRQDRRAAAAERIEDDAVAPAAVTDQIGDERYRLDSGVQVELTAPGWVQTVDARIIKHVGAISAFGAETKVVDVGSSAVFEDDDQLVL